MMKKLFSLLKLKKDENGKPTMLSYVIIVGLVGLLIMIVSNSFKEDRGGTNPNLTLPEETSERDTNDSPISQDDKLAVIKQMESDYEQKLKTILEKLNGVSDVDIMVNLDATSLKVYEKNTIKTQQNTNESDTNGGERDIEEISQEQQTVIIRNSNQESPLLIQVKKPDVSGVMVVASGLDNLEVKKMVIEAVAIALDVPTHRVSANPK
jgi:stage III sporulation protein AG